MFNRRFIILIILSTFVLSSCNKNEMSSILNSDNDTQQTAKVDSIQKPVDSGEIESGGELYKNDKLGFSFVIPSSWSGKYALKEENDGLYVFFKPSEPVYEGEGLLFAILKKTAVADENTFDSVGEPRIFQAKGIIYITGGSTDIGFSESHKEFVNFINMKKEVRNVVETIKIID